ncbi:hypothetical protein AB0939_29815 [Streptomyces sp. NPDC006990]|uniref:hypothetical protein n=1 Tax=Streptomyces sp. NPDC006990 TaxID=3154481 RepID=UPI003454FC87
MKDEAAERAEAERALEAPGARRIKAKADLRKADVQLKPLVSRAVRANVPIRRIAEMTGLTTNTVMLWGKE